MLTKYNKLKQGVAAARRWLPVLGLLWLASALPVRAQPLPLSVFPFTVEAAALQGAPDASDLNRPLTQADHVVVHQGQFWRADLSERIRFFGVSLSFSSNFPDAAEAAQLARELRRLGFNAVRLHHLDTQPGHRQPPSSILGPGPYPEFNTEAVQRLKTLIQALSNEGIYINLNLRVGYVFRPEVDAVPAYDPERMARPIGAPIVVYHPRLRQLQEQYASELIERLGLRNHPALAMVEINNESSLLASWQRREWLDAIPGEYGALLRAQWQAWQIARYGSIAAACEHWRGCDAAGRAGALLHPGWGTSVADNALEAIFNKVHARWHHWRGTSPAVASLYGDDDPESARRRDFMLFLAETDRAYFARIREVVQQAAGFAVPVTGTQMNYGGILNLSSHAQMDYIDDHFYVDHPDFLEGFSNLHNWRIWNDGLTGGRMDDLLRRAFWRERGKPFVMSELNHPHPSLPGAEFLPITAAVALLQDWDGLFFYDYDGARRQPVAPASFGLRGDWGKYVTVAQVARWFRQGGLAPLPDTLALPVPSALQAAVAAQSRPSLLAELLRGQFGLLPQHVWSHRLGVDVSPTASPSPALLAPEALEQAPGTLEQTADGALRFDRSRGVLEVESEQLWAYMGPQPGAQTPGQGLALRLRGAAPQHATVLLSSLDGRAVPTSRRLLLTLGGATVGTQPGSNPPRPKQFVRHPAGDHSWTLEPDPTHLDQPSGSRDAQGPAWITQSQGEVSWRSAATQVTVYPLDGAGQRRAALPPERVRIQDGRVRVDVQQLPAETSPWYEIIATIAAPSQGATPTHATHP